MNASAGTSRRAGQTSKPSATLSVLTCLIVAGCASTSFQPYTGAQLIWATNPAASPQNANGILVYKSAPERPYKLLGEVSSYTSPQLRFWVSDFAFSEARRRGADAIIMLESGSVLAGYTTSGSIQNWGTFSTVQAHSNPIYHGRARAIAVKFLTSEEIANLSARATLTDLDTGEVLQGGFNLITRQSWVWLPDRTALIGNLFATSSSSGGTGATVLRSPDGRIVMDIQVTSSPDGRSGTGSATTNTGKRYRVIW